MKDSFPSGAFLCLPWRVRIKAAAWRRGGSGWLEICISIAEAHEPTHARKTSRARTRTRKGGVWDGRGLKTLHLHQRTRRESTGAQRETYIRALNISVGFIFYEIDSVPETFRSCSPSPCFRCISAEWEWSAGRSAGTGLVWTRRGELVFGRRLRWLGRTAPWLFRYI